ncbi:MAG: hypothetical protein DMF49_08555 [Acidobacteria bacterium]|nr:MAG: hypothetical protein DMF49_08555 [Acidobacteriota bacterium]
MSNEELPRASSAQRGGRVRGRPRRAEDTLRGRLRPQDPFELIRWLALSQPDPRKALAELVQNSLDARAHKIHITRLRERGAPCLKIFDDGEGVISEMDRPEALKFIATHIGHSRKRSLSPQERLTLMTQGQYGIGLLGFWSLGGMLEMRTVVPGQKPFKLVLHRDRPDYSIEPLRGRLPIDERWTEVVVVGLHSEAMGALVGRRAADYLASELRGQLLAREVNLLIDDRMSRGRARKSIAVRPPRFLGERIEGIGPLEVPGYPSIRLEIYLTAGSEEDESHRLAVYSSGTLVAEGFHDLGALGLDSPPWTDPRLSGLVDFPGFNVAPGSRRGVIADEAAGALLPVRSEKDAAPAPGGRRDSGGPAGTVLAEAMDQAAAGPGQAASAELPPGIGEAAPPPQTPPPDLLPAGPLAAVRLTPSPIRVECGGRKRVQATGVDAIGSPVEGPVSYSWRLSGLVDFPGFNVAPGSRRGVIADEAAGAFARAIASIAPVLAELLESLDRRRAEEVDRTLIRDLQRCAAARTRAWRSRSSNWPRSRHTPTATSPSGAEQERARGSRKVTQGGGSPPRDGTGKASRARIRFLDSALILSLDCFRNSSASPVAGGRGRGFAGERRVPVHEPVRRGPGGGGCL